MIPFGLGYVVTPQPVHLLLSEPERGNSSIVMQAIKQSFARKRRMRADIDPQMSPALDQGDVWPVRFYDFVVFTERKRVQKWRYMHRNPVKRGLGGSRSSGLGAAFGTMRMTKLDQSW